MNLESLKSWTREHEESLRAYDVKRLFVFGSVSRGEEGPDSDLDLIVEFAGPATLSGFYGLERFLERELGTHVDLATPRELKPPIRDRILSEAVRLA